MAAVKPTCCKRRMVFIHRPHSMHAAKRASPKYAPMRAPPALHHPPLINSLNSAQVCAAVHIRQFAVHGDLPVFCGGLNRRHGGHIPHHRQRAVFQVQRWRELPINRHFINRRYFCRSNQLFRNTFARAACTCGSSGSRKKYPNALDTNLFSAGTAAACSIRSASIQHHT